MFVPQNYMSLALASDVNSICAPLQNLGITYFNHIRFYRNGSISGLVTNPEWYRFCFETEFPGGCSIYDLKSGIYLLQDIMPPEVITSARESFNIDNLFQFLNNQKDFVEVFCFGTQNNSTHTPSFYFNHQDLLQNFVEYFKQKSSDLFKKVDRNRLVIPTVMQAKNEVVTYPNISAPIKTNFEKELSLKKYYLSDNKNYYVTQREAECLLFLCKGRSAKEIAAILNISQRTVENYFNNIKLRTNLYSKSQLISLFESSDIGKCMLIGSYSSDSRH